MQKPTLKSVAAALGVSKTTVSNAFSRPDQLSDSLRNHILEQSRALGYFGPDLKARALRSKELTEVGVVFHHDLSYAMSDHSTIEFLQGVTHELDKHQLTLQIIPKMGRTLLLNSAFQTTSDILIIHTEIGQEFIPELLGANKPFVLIDSCLPDFPWIGIEDRKGAYLSMQHALSKQPDRIIIICLQYDKNRMQQLLTSMESETCSFVAEERLLGYLIAAREVGVDLDKIIWLEVDSQYPESTTDQLIKIKDESLKPGETFAIVAMSDRLALNAMDTVKRWRRNKVVSIVGFDDIPAAKAAGLTTIHQDMFLKGQLAVQVLMNEAKPSRLPVELIVRDT